LSALPFGKTHSVEADRPAAALSSLAELTPTRAAPQAGLWGRSSNVTAITYRQAGLDDAAEIHDLLLRVAPEIPLITDTLEREEALYALTRTCARSGESWVACDQEGRITGFVLAELSVHGRHYGEHEILQLHYAGVAPEHRKRGVFGELVAKLQGRMLPITTRVNRLNQAGAARQFERHGFRPGDTPGSDSDLRWEPGAG
jgi:GNAT superfamily N-acetyltransferase